VWLCLAKIKSLAWNGDVAEPGFSVVEVCLRAADTVIWLLSADKTDFCHNRLMSFLGDVVDATPHGPIGSVNRPAEGKK
jgi:hypothetical protein